MENTHNIEVILLELADNMAAAASCFTSHGYDTFIQSRDTFKDALRTIAATLPSDCSVP